VPLGDAVLADGKSINSKNADSKYNDPEYIRVSDILKVVSKGDRMVRWYFKFDSYKEMMESFRKSAERGSMVDNITKELMLGNTPEVPAEYQPYIDAFKKWQSEWSFNLMFADEEVSDSELQYVGTLDLYGILRAKRASKEERVVIDIKTGVPTRDKEGNLVYEAYNSMHWQTAAYAHALKKVHKVDGTYILRLFSDGNYLFEPDKDPKKSFTVFKHALGIRRLIGKIT
jgi:hypothetical protein